MTDLRTAAQQALEALHEETAWFGPTPKGAAAIAALRDALAQEQAEPVEPVPQSGVWMHPRPPVKAQQAEPKGGGNLPPPLQAEPVQEPVAWRFQSAVGGWAYGSQPPLGSKYPVHPLYTVPPRCPNCASLEAQNNELDRKLAEVERAHGIGEKP